MFLSLAKATAAPWKNGGGTTRELAVRMDNGHLVWRLSLADISADGAFSAFPGLSRIHCIVEGAGLTLSNQNTTLEARPFQPLHFDGGLNLSASLADGPCRAFNVIYDPQLVQARAQVLAGGAIPPHAGEQVLFVISGQLDCGALGRFAAGEGILTGADASGTAAAGSHVVQVAFSPV